MKGKARSQHADVKLRVRMNAEILHREHPLLLLSDQQVCLSPNYSQRESIASRVFCHWYSKIIGYQNSSKSQNSHNNAQPRSTVPWAQFMSDSSFCYRTKTTVLPLQPPSPSTHLCWLCTAGCLASWRGRGACFWPRRRPQGAGWRTCSQVCTVQLGADGKRRAEWVRAAEDGASESYRVREEEKEEEEEEEEKREDRAEKGEEGEERRDVAQMLGAWGGLIAVSVCVCVSVRESVCVCATCLWAGISRLVGPAWGCGASLCSETGPAPSERLPVPELQRWWRLGAWRGSASPLPCINTHTHTHTHRVQNTHSSPQFCCCHDNHKSMFGQTNGEKSCGYT